MKVEDTLSNIFIELEKGYFIKLKITTLKNDYIFYLHKSELKKIYNAIKQFLEEGKK